MCARGREDDGGRGASNQVVGQTKCRWQDCTFRVDWSRQRAEVACLTLHKVLAFFVQEVQERERRNLNPNAAVNLAAMPGVRTRSTRSGVRAKKAHGTFLGEGGVTRYTGTRCISPGVTKVA